MRAAVYDEFKGPINVLDVPDPVPGPGEVILEVKASGICRSDWHGWQGHDPDIRELPHVPGHEMAGVIEAVGPEVVGWSRGDRVTVPFVAGCGTCEFCIGGNPQVCPHQAQPGFTHWGSFAELVRVRYAQHNLVPLPDEFDFVSAAALGCRFATAYRALLQQGRLEEGEWLAVFGCGGVGLSAVMIGAAIGARVAAVDISTDALDLADRLGAAVTLRPDDDLVERLVEVTGGGAHVGLDAVGNPDLVRASMAALRRRGRHLQVGLLVGDATPTPVKLDRLIAHELEIIGSHGIGASSLAEVLDFVTSKGLDLDMLVSEELSLEEGAERLESFADASGSGVAVVNRY